MNLDRRKVRHSEVGPRITIAAVRRCARQWTWIVIGRRRRRDADVRADLGFPWSRERLVHAVFGGAIGIIGLAPVWLTRSDIRQPERFQLCIWRRQHAGM